MAIIKQSTVFQRQFNLKLAGTQNPATGKAGSCVPKISKNGAALSTPAGAVSELAQGGYVIAYTAADTNTVGSLGLYVTDAACDPYNAPDLDQILPGTLLTGGTGADQVSTSGGGVDLKASSVYAQALVPFQAAITQVNAPPTLSGFEIGVGSFPTYNDQSFRDYVVLASSGTVAGEFHRIKAWNHLTHWADFVTPWTQVLPAGTTLNLMPWGGSDYLASDALARLLGLTAENVVEDDVLMDPNGSGYRISWTYYLYDTAAHATAHVTGGGGGTGLLYKYAVLREIASGLVKRATVTRTL